MNVVRLADHCEITSSKRIYAKEYEATGVLFLRGKEIIERFMHHAAITSDLFISETRYETIKQNFGVPASGDILLTSVGTIGIPYRVATDEPFYFKDGNLTWFRKFQGINSKYFYYWLISPLGKRELAKCTIGVAQPAYTIVRLKEMKLVLPSEASQTKIACLLSNYDTLIENNKRRIEILEESARQLYKEWFVRFRFPGHEHVKIVDGVPEGWDSCKASEALFINPKVSIEKGKEIYYVPMASLSENQMTVDNTKFEKRTKHTSVKFSNGDTLFARITPCCVFCSK